MNDALFLIHLGLFNLRGSDIRFNPVFFAYALVTANSAVLFLREGGATLSTEAKQALDADNIAIASYEAAAEQLALQTAVLPGKILISPTCNWKIAEAVGRTRIVSKPSPVTAAKAIKNEVELNGFRQCHIRDGAAFIRYLAWLEDQPDGSIDEVDGAERLEQFRAEDPYYRGLSFATASATGSNGAIIHYKAEKSTAAKITATQLYLCDAGAQYLDGTTDTTRTVHFGTPTAYEKECFTRVLKGNLTLGRAIFPERATGQTLDVLARLSLWEAGLDFLHSTGHGVGHYLTVHEGPHFIGFRPAAGETKLAAGMTVTNGTGRMNDFDSHCACL